MHQDQLQTALCKVNGYVLIVQGECRGKRGKLLERNSEKDRAVVQLDADQSLVKCRLDDVAEHAGDPNDIDAEDARRDFDF
jgi:ribosomal protein L24